MQRCKNDNLQARRRPRQFNLHRPLCLKRPGNEERACPPDQNQIWGITDLKKQHAQVGQIAVLKHGTRWIIHLVTKEYYHNKPTQAAIYSTLVHMRQFMLKQGLTIIGIPKLATGLDKQPWPIIEQMIHKIFNDCNILIIVHIL